VYCGTTTNESFKWSVYKDDMEDGFAFRRHMPSKRARDLVKEPICSRWPVEPDMVLAATDDGKPPPPQMGLAGDGEWERIWKLKDVENLYDMGFWDNMGDIFVTEYRFGSRSDDLSAERGARRQRTKNK
jgi:palmitoyltransferase